MKMYKVTITETAKYVYYMRANSAEKAGDNAEQDFLANITLGGRCKETEVTDRDVVSVLVKS